MKHPLVVVHVRTTKHAAQGLSAPLIHAQMGGLRVSIESRARAPSPPGTVRFRIDQLEEAHVIAASSPGCVVDVAEDCRRAFVRFLQDCRGTSSDFTACVLTTTPDEQSQGSTIDAVSELFAAGMVPGQIRIIHADAPPDCPTDTAYGMLAQFREQHGALDHWRTDAVLSDAPAFLRLQRDHSLLGELLHGTLDFQAELERARRAGADEGSLRELMRKVLSQRMLLGIADDIGKVFDSLSLPRISSAAWREEAERFVASRRDKLLHTGPGSEDRVQPTVNENETAPSM
jgi:hypothetical protein